MIEGIHQSNYLEWVKLAQRSYVVSYICAFIMLSHVLTIDSETSKDMLSLPVLSVSFPRLPAVLFSLLLYFMSGMFLMASYSKLKELSGVMAPEILAALKNYPSIGNSSWKLEIIILLGLYLVFLAVFANGTDEKSTLKSAWLALVVSGFHVTAFGFKALNKSFDPTPKGGAN